MLLIANFTGGMIYFATGYNENLRRKFEGFSSYLRQMGDDAQAWKGTRNEKSTAGIAYGC